MSVFYSTFERHAHGEGLKGHSTHYCPGCGHGLAHKFLAESIDELGIQDRTIAISPVGCSVFLYYYLDVGNSQAAHGRAPAVALGHKMANPESIVISYQGDGDLASIGLAEIIHAAQLGLPITVIFVNNAIYGMTGGQMAPTTLPGMKTMTSPYGRNQFMGSPLRMAEMIAQIDAPIYVERVALFDSKQRNRAKKAIKKGLTLQMENKGFSFVEVLAECPTHLHMTPTDAQEWVKSTMITWFPLGVKKDVEPANTFQFDKPVFKADTLRHLAGASNEKVKKFSDGFPSHVAPLDISLKLAGSGGDGAQTAALLITRTAINEGFDSTHIPSYGPESRGGTSYADVHIAEMEVLSPSAPHPNILLAFNQPSMDKFGPKVKEGGIIVGDSTVIHTIPTLERNVRVVLVPLSDLAKKLGKVMVKNVVALGALQAATNLFPPESFLTALRQALKDKHDLIPLNEEAFRAGMASVKEE
ncbi:MAG: 2-oxoacid:acceptor oxidoreductase family protein [Bacteroidetes bacterium]|nr:2-oxoacid:acceptor oxidoreductase family protein [Bacteroidota bacterium]